MAYRIQLFYNPRKIGMRFLQDMYRVCGLESPPVEVLRKPFYTDKKRDVEMARTEFITPRKDKVLELTELVMDLPNTRIEISKNDPKENS